MIPIYTNQYIFFIFIFMNNIKINMIDNNNIFIE